MATSPSVKVRTINTEFVNVGMKARGYTRVGKWAIIKE